MVVRLLVVLVYLFTGYCHAQTLTGMVRDIRTNRPVSGASIQVVQFSRRVITNRQGHFSMHKLPRGTYTMRVSSAGYQLVEERITITNRTDLYKVIHVQPSLVLLNQQAVIAADRTNGPDFNKPEVTTVVSNRELRQRPPRTVPEALAGATGVWIQQSSQGGGSPVIRGLTGQQTLLLVDGIRLNTFRLHARANEPLTTIDPQHVEQLDVLRSSGSVAYGSDAIGGIVNVLTRSPQFSERPGFNGRVFTRTMTQRMGYAGRAELGFEGPSFALLGGLAYRTFGDFVAGKGLGRQMPTNYNQLSGDLTVRFRLPGRFVATLAYQQTKQDSVPVYESVYTGTYAPYQLKSQRRQLAYARLDGLYNRRFLESAQLTASWQRQGERWQNTSSSASDALDRTTTLGLTLLTNAKPYQFWQMQNGLEWYFDQARTDDYSASSIESSTGSTSMVPDRAFRNSLALFSMHTLAFDRLTLTGGGRYNAFWIQSTGPGVDKKKISPSALAGNLGLSYALLPAVRFVAAVQSAFRVPTVTELQTLGVVDLRYGNPTTSLRPERSFNKEAGFKIRTPRFAATVLAYHNQLRNFSNYRPIGPDSALGHPGMSTQPVTQAFIRGIEAEAEGEVSAGWLAGAGATYTYGQNVTTRETLPMIPPLNGRFRLTYQPQTSWWGRAELRWASRPTRLSAEDKDGTDLGIAAWQVVDLTGGYRWKNINFSAEIQNLTNASYRPYGSGLYGIGRSAWLSASINL